MGHGLGVNDLFIVVEMQDLSGGNVGAESKAYGVCVT